MQRLLLLIYSFSILFSTAVYAAASSFVNTISDLKISSTTTQEKIQLTFRSDFKETVSTDFESGLIQITFPKTEFDASLTYLNVNDRFIHNIRLIKAAGSSILEIHFANPSFDAIGMIKEETEGNRVTVLINKSAKFESEEHAELSVLNRENNNQLTQEPSLLDGDTFTRGDMTTSIVKMLVALFLLLLFFYLLLWAYNRFFVTRFRFNKGKYDIKVSSSCHISPKQKIIVLEINGAAYACGVTANNISVISKVSADSFSAYLSNLDLSRNNEISFVDIRTQYLEDKKRKGILHNDQKEPESKFASALLSRVKNLKPLD
ncbi:MAG: flagellar biosynthetic protein FliO [SAR324 cluster bacterium]|nr:flagellar biosynthetic protein FliO [SAR324 cluster bacterium]